MSERFEGGLENFQWSGDRILDPQQVPQPVVVKFQDFSRGYNSSVAPENTPEGAAKFMLDMELSRQDRLVRAPGTSPIETFTRTPQVAVLQPGFFYASELVLLDPPFVGVKYLAETTWTDEGIVQGQYSFANYAGVLLFSAGSEGMYARQPTGTVSLVPTAPAAKAVSVFAGRVVVGGTFNGTGTFDPMLLGWSDALGDFGGWDQTEGAGFEALIVDSPFADRIVALKPMGFDYLAILNRRSIWIAARTGDPFRPIDPQPRIDGVGCLAERTVFRTEKGVIFLSDDGVRIFSGNESIVVSDPINEELLTLTEQQLSSCTGGYNPSTKRYYLFTTIGTWVLDLNKMRWFRWSSQFDMMAIFPTQSGGASWDASVGTWDEQIGAWDSELSTEDGMPTYFVKGTAFVREDYSSTAALGVELRPRWDGRTDVGEELDQIMRTDRITVVHEGSGRITIALPDFTGDYEDVRSLDLLAPGPSVIAVNHSGRGAGIGFRYEAGSNLRIRRATLRCFPSALSR